MPVAARTCIVTVTDRRGIRQSVEVTAESVFETAARALPTGSAAAVSVRRLQNQIQSGHPGICKRQGMSTRRQRLPLTRQCEMFGRTIRLINRVEATREEAASPVSARGRAAPFPSPVNHRD
jgi:hypothetical protein